MKTSTLRQIIKEEIDSTLNENNVLKVIKHLSNKMKEYDTPMGEKEFNDGVRRGLALAITKLNEIK
jgi:hypothetical protein